MHQKASPKNSVQTNKLYSNNCVHSCQREKDKSQMMKTCHHTCKRKQNPEEYAHITVSANIQKRTHLCTVNIPHTATNARCVESNKNLAD